MCEAAESRGIDGVFQIGILENDQCAVSAELKQRFFEMFDRQLPDIAADLR